MESAPIVVILKRPTNSLQDDNQAVEYSKSRQATKSLEEKRAKYEEARRRILGSDHEEEQDVSSVSETEEQAAVSENSLELTRSPSPPAMPTTGSPEKAARKPVAITPLMSIEFKQASGLSLETAMENMSIGGNSQAVEEVGRRKKSLFKVENFVQAQHHYVAPPVPNNFHLRQFVNNSIMHPYANSNMNHVRPHHYPPPYVVSHSQPRFTQNHLVSLSAGQANFVPNPPFPLHVPPPGYYHNNNNQQAHVQFISQMSNQSFASQRIGLRNDKHHHRHLDMNSS